MSRQKEGKVIHVDKLTIHAKEVEIIQEKSRENHEHRRHPLDFFGPRRRPDRNEHEGEHHKESGDRVNDESSDRHRGPRWL